MYKSWQKYTSTGKKKYQAEKEVKFQNTQKFINNYYNGDNPHLTIVN